MSEIPELQELTIPSNIRSLCSFASYSYESIDIPLDVLIYISNLAKYFDHIILSTNINATDLSPTTTSLIPHNCTIYTIPNVGLDFGMHWRVLKHVQSRKDEFERIALVNDSCILLNDLESTINWGKDRNFWGITKSLHYHPHIQSYFIIINGTTTIDTLFEFLTNNDIYKYTKKDQIIQDFEIGLSKFMSSKGIKLEALFSHDNIEPKLKIHQKNINPAFTLWANLLRQKCPMIKKQRAKLHYGKDYITFLALKTGGLLWEKDSLKTIL